MYFIKHRTYKLFCLQLANRRLFIILCEICICVFAIIYEYILLWLYLCESTTLVFKWLCFDWELNIYLIYSLFVKNFNLKNYILPLCVKLQQFPLWDDSKSVSRFSNYLCNLPLFYLVAKDDIYLNQKFYCLIFTMTVIN